jgi:hypothetical protein
MNDVGKVALEKDQSHANGQNSPHQNDGSFHIVSGKWRKKPVGGLKLYETHAS